MLGIFNTSGKRKRRYQKNNQNGSHHHFILLTKTDALEWLPADFPGQSICEKNELSIIHHPSQF
jgi:hypothetical protein